MSVSSIDVKNSKLGMSTFGVDPGGTLYGHYGVHQELLLASSV